MKNHPLSSFSILIITLLFSVSVARAQTPTLYRANSETKQTLHAVLFPTDTLGAAVGNSSTISVTLDGGYSWQIDPPTTDVNLYTEFFSDSANGALAGDSGTILISLQSSRPTKVSLPETNPIYGMTFPSYDTGIVCGASGLFYMTTDSGKTWNKKTLPAGAQKYDFHGTDYFDDDTYWLVGQNGTVLYTESDGDHWQVISVPTTRDLYSIYFPDDGSSTGWIVGDSTLLITIDGGDNWASIGTTDKLRSVEGWDSTDAYAVGLNGQILFTTNRSNWNTLPTGTTANLYGFDYTDDWLYFVGDSGIILTTLPQTAPPPPYQPNFVVEGDFSVPGSELSFGNIPDGMNAADDATVINVSNVPVTIQTISCDSSEFTINPGNPTPFTLDSGTSRVIQLTFTPRISATVQTYHSMLRVFSTQDTERDAPLLGVGEPSANSVASPANTGEANMLLTCGSRSSFIAYPNNWVGPIRLEVFNVLGASVYFSDDVLTSRGNVLPASLPLGVYMYRLSGTSRSQVGKFSLE